MPDPTRSVVLRRSLIALAVVIVLAAAGWWIGRPKPIPVVVQAVDRGKVESSVANTRAGTVDACQRTKLSTIIGGRIESLAVKEGDRVKQGPVADEAVERRPAGAEHAGAGTGRPRHGKRVERSLHRCRQRRTRGRTPVRAARARASSRTSQGRCGTHRGAGQARRLRCRQGRCRPGRGEAQGHPRRAGPHRALRAVRRHRRQDRRRSRRILDAVAARRADAAGDRPDRRLLSLRHGADGRSRCAEDPARPAGADQPRCAAQAVLSRQGAARRALRFGGREAGAHGRHRSHFRPPGDARQAAGRLQRRRRSHPRRARQRAARSDRGAARRRPRAGGWAPTASSKNARSRPGSPTGNSPKCWKA